MSFNRLATLHKDDDPTKPGKMLYFISSASFSETSSSNTRAAPAIGATEYDHLLQVPRHKQEKKEA